jgi:uncharacterized protein (DUF427 family)
VKPTRVEPGPGQESVWDYPRPPRVEPERRRARVELGGRTIADSRRAVRVLEMSSPPTVYFPPEDVATDVLEPAEGITVCEWKGDASYFDVVVGATRARRAAWTYRAPNPSYAELAGWISFYPGRVDACVLGEERVRAQAGLYYGGWVTSEVVGPFKGEPGTESW